MPSKPSNDGPKEVKPTRRPQIQHEEEQSAESTQQGQLSVERGEIATLAKTIELLAVKTPPCTTTHMQLHRAIERQAAFRAAIETMQLQHSRTQLRRHLSRYVRFAKSQKRALQAALAHDETVPLGDIFNGHFRLYSTKLFDLLDHPATLKLGTLRFDQSLPPVPDAPFTFPSISIEIALNDSFWLANSHESPYHPFILPSSANLRNNGIRARKAEHEGWWPVFDSWLLFTFFGRGCLRVEVPIEMCADVWGCPEMVEGREGADVVFWGVFVPDQESW